MSVTCSFEESREARRATLMSRFEEEKGKQLELDGARVAEVWSACNSCYGTKCLQLRLSNIFGIPHVMQNRILCI